jgi:hypothetical protein
MQAGIEDAVVGPQQFLAAVAGNAAELLVDVSDPTLQVGLGKDRSRIHGCAIVVIHKHGPSG